MAITTDTTTLDPLLAALDAAAADGADHGLVHVERIAARPARFADLTSPLPPALAERVAEVAGPRLWVHQARAIDLLRQGSSVAIATGTASGKSLCYQVPIAE